MVLYRHGLKALALSAACLPMMFGASYAARIYNQTNGEITVQGQPLGGHVSIAPRGESGSLEWTLVNQVSAFGGSGGSPLCNLDFGSHAQIQGGNYMIVAPASGHVNCGVCDSNHKILDGVAKC
jgi:hypothetical protein